MSYTKTTTYDLCKKMRTEVSYVANRMYFLVDNIDSDSLRKDFKDYIRRLNDLVENVSLVPRNCDVGTAKEQMQRFLQFCKPHKNCENCPCEEADECKLTWAQMPYESEVDDTTETREEPEFKPCPFCGSTDIYHYRTDFGSADSPYVHVIRCKDCNASIYAKSGKYKDSIKLWNREAKESEVDNENNEKK